MRIRHLNCATLCPPFARLVTGRGGLVGRSHMVCHCLLVETSSGLALVDTGLGTLDVGNPARLGGAFLSFTRPALQASETALAQVQALGFAPADLRHIPPTHLDLDHAGGLARLPRNERAHLHDRACRRHATAQRTRTPALPPGALGARPALAEVRARW
ncbi:MAG TPA: MBL fold metallo-hydrolase [Polyangiales bacterium]